MLAAPSVRLHLDLSRLQARGCLGRAICGTPLDVCEAHTMSVMRSELEEAVDGWHRAARSGDLTCAAMAVGEPIVVLELKGAGPNVDRKSTRLNSSHVSISYAVFCLKKK